MRRVLSGFVIVLVSVGLVLGWWACSRPRPLNVLLVTLDTLRADRLGSYGYAQGATPHLDALAARGLRFERAATVMPLTLPAHASLMTGTFPAFHGVRDNGGFYLDASARTLAEVLQESGYRTGGFVGAFVLDSRWGIAQGFEKYFDEFDLSKYDKAPGMDAIQRPGSAVVDQALDWMLNGLASPSAGTSGDERPFFAWVHLYDPHTPYEAPEPFRSRFPPTRSGAYDAEIAATDAQVGRLLSALKDAGQTDNTVVVILSDHGEMLGEHDELTHGFFIYDAAVRIPLLMAGPGFPVARVEEQVRIIDVLPTVLARLGLDPPEDVQGIDLLPRIPNRGGAATNLYAHSESWFPRYHYGWSELQSIQDGRYKFIKAPTPELYDLERDPGELDNLALTDPDKARDLERRLVRLLRDVTSEAARRGPEAVDPETAERLRALGYLGASSSRRDSGVGSDGSERGDPKEKIGLYNLLKESTTASARGDFDQAITRVERVLAEDPEIIEAHMLLGNFHRKAERSDQSIAAYQAALGLDPENEEALYNLALAYKQQGRVADALAGFERAASLDPRNGRVIWQVADVHMRVGRFEDAEAELRKGLELDLDRARFLAKLGECYLEMGRLPEAERSLSEALVENPELGSALFHLGLTHERQDRAGAAVEVYRRALKVSPEAYKASFNLAKLLLQAKQLREAVAFFEKTVEIQPQFGTGHLYLAKALLDTGNLNAAAAAAKTGLVNEPESSIAPLGHFILADIYSRQGRGEDAAREEQAGRRLQGGGEE